MADFHSNKSEHDRKFDKAVEKALRLVGGQAERLAKEIISEMGAVDTGFLRNSITFALDGEQANVSEYQDDAENQQGEYHGEADENSDGTRSVMIGSNVYYAPYIEYGTRKMQARPFLATAVQSGKEQFEQLFRDAFSHFF